MMEENHLKCGFTDEETGSVSLPSVWRKNQQSAQDSKACQTVVLHSADVLVQTVSVSSSGSQTEAQDQEQPFVQGDHAPSAPGLKEFLQRVEDVVTRELVRNAQSHAFHGYQVKWEEPSQQVSLLHHLHPPCATERNLHVSCVSWSCTGSRIVCGYGRMDDGDWSTQSSFVCAWNLDRGVLSRKTDLMIDVHTTVTALSCHPTYPALIAGGLFTGEVLVWDSSRTLDPVLARTGMLAESHREPVYHVSWVSLGQKKEDLQVLSCCSGGKILLWTLNSDPTRLVLSDAFALVLSQIPHSSSFKGRGSSSSSVGVTSLAVSPWDSDTFLVGCEGGLLLRCSFSCQTLADISSSSEQAVPLRAPVVFTFTQNKGPVHSIHCSAFHRNLFLCCGTDGSVHLHSLLQADPLMSVRVSDCYLFQVQWSPSRPLVFAVATGQGEVHLYDLGRRSLKPSSVLQRDGSRQPSTCLNFNSHNPRLLAVGSADGSVCVWQLSAELTQQDTREGGTLELIANQVSE
ncbi:cytoplasmic dynein 2 intermediate chain 2 [Gouania willdenowi]|uniref:cytoplasmic dynein 2 intermediate chain 2 n=1 Tax=Gouania willdenowi TaxID=441366 RepID=UPI00105653E2|nr:WD repeat-containing protein 34 [Gouania willdenowi]